VSAAPWDSAVERAIELRRALHSEPELTWAEHDTAARVRAALDQLGLPWRPCAATGPIAPLAPAAGGRHVALRADLDALPIHEQTDLPWRSRRDGCMHACGHDGHTATLYAAAAWLAAVEDRLPGPVTLLFQPAEEGGHGARRMIDDGALDGVDAIFGWHNWPAIPLGRAVCPDGVVMAGNGTYRLTLRGAGGHASQPELCRDPVLAAAAVVQALQQIVSRRLPAQAATVLSITSIDARSNPTVIPDDAVIEGSFRIADAADRERLGELMTEIATGTAAGYGVDCAVELFPRYGPTVNHAEEAARYRGALAGEFGPGVFDGGTRVPIMASEDFSYYLRERPGAFALVGAGDGQACHQVPCHSARYDFNDALIAPMARVYARLAGSPLPDAARPHPPADEATTEERQ
jgi:hippurate hydrolase